MTTVVVVITSSLLGHVTCFITTGTSWRNSRASVTVPLTRAPIPAAAPVIALLLDSSFFTFTDCVAIKPSSHPGALPCSVLQFLAGEEGFEPPYPVLETGVLAVGRLPFTLSPRSGRRVYPFPVLHKLKLLCPA